MAHALERRCSASGEIGVQKGNVSHSGEWNCITHIWGSRFSVVTTPVCRTRTISGGQWISDLPSKPQPTPSKFDKGSELYAGLVLNMVGEEWSSSKDKGGIALCVTEMNCPWKQIWKGPEDQSLSKNFPPLFFLGCVLQLGIRLRAVSSITAALTVVRKSSRKDQRYSTYLTMYRLRSWKSHPATYSTCLLAATKDLLELRVVRLDLEDCMRKIKCLLTLETGIPVFASLTSAKKLLPARATILGKEESTYLASCSQCCKLLRRTKYCCLKEENV